MKLMKNILNELIYDVDLQKCHMMKVWSSYYCEIKKNIFKNKPFENLDDGPLNIVSPLPTENVPINVGNLAAVGRNVVLQNIVESLSYTWSTQTRLVHIFGVGGIGKTFVAKHAAKYLFERRNFDHGCIYIELKNKYAVGENLSSLICNTMGIPSTDKSTLWKFITKSKILIILDKSSKVEKLDQNMLNKTLEYFIDETEIPKFIVVTENSKDISIGGKLQFEIDELKPREAARLLLLWANQYIEESNKNLETLSNHEIFKLISRNPSWIVRFAQFLKSCSNTLDEIVFEQQNQIKQLNRISIKKDDDQLGTGDEDWTWVISKSYEYLMKNYSDQIVILFTLWQFPSGVFDSDFANIFEQNFPKWKEFLNVLMKYRDKITDESKVKTDTLDVDEATFWLISSQFVEEIQENHYTPYQIVYSYINKIIITPEEKQSACQTAIIYLSNLSRRLTRSLKKSEIVMLSLTKFTAAIDVGLWSDSGDFQDPIFYYKDYENLINEPKLMFSYHESNFQQFLDLEFLSSIFPSKGKLQSKLII